MAPTKGDDDQGKAKQANAWAAVNTLLREGKSWSGRERNNAYLNLADGSFADISYLSGVGFLDDARGAAALDWDADGDLDLWLNNRSSPKVRFMRNDDPGGNHYVAFRLERGSSYATTTRSRINMQDAGRCIAHYYGRVLLQHTASPMRGPLCPPA